MTPMGHMYMYVFYVLTLSVVFAAMVIPADGLFTSHCTDAPEYIIKSVFKGSPTMHTEFLLGLG